MERIKEEVSKMEESLSVIADILEEKVSKLDDDATVFTAEDLAVVSGITLMTQILTALDSMNDLLNLKGIEGTK